jgi:hypothetical protein
MWWIVTLVSIWAVLAGVVALWLGRIIRTADDKEGTTDV